MRRRENGRERGKEGGGRKGEREEERDHQMRHSKSLAVNTWGPVFKATIWRTPWTVPSRTESLLQ